MSASRNIFDELAKVADGAASAVSGVRGEVEGLIRQQLERLLADMDMVPREEFEAVREMAAKARAEQDKLAQRLAELETRIVAAPAKKTRSAKPKRPAAES